MSDDDPFAEPGDTERTVVKPSPAGRHRASAQPEQPQPAASPPPEPTAPQGDAFGVPQQAAAQSGADEAATIAQAVTGMNTLNACASTLFLLVSRIRNRAQHMDPTALRRSVAAEIRAFESRALQSGIDAQQVRVARYAICATIDDVVLNTPWGGQSVWTQQSMVGTFHKETVGGDRFYDLLARLESDPANNIDMLEFIYQCLSLGFEGRLRVEQGGADKHLQIRNGLARIIRAQRGAVEQDLSPQWAGVTVPHKPRSIFALAWIVSGVLAVALSVTFFALWVSLDGRTERALGLLSGLEGTLPATLARRAPPPPPPPDPPPRVDQLVKVKDFLEPEIANGTVEVFGKANTLTVRLVGRGMFPSGSDQVKPEFTEGIVRVARTLNSEPGRIIIAGHSDSIPVGSGRFGSNMALSLARAESVRAIIAREFDDPARVVAEGRGEKEPIASNATRDGRARNRRIEIILIRGAQ